jgi:GMP synthase (glutamine-hydrolysing)
MSKTVLALRHVAFEDLGAFAPALEEAGYRITYADIGMDRIGALPDADLMVVLGGPIGVYEADLYPWLRDEIGLIAKRLDRGRATLGICLGAQVMARALGAPVAPGPAKEIGWKPLTLTRQGESILGPLTGLPVLHWHGDRFDLPDGAVSLAATDLCPHQAFAMDSHALAFQFHPEAWAPGFERWLIGHALEIATTPGVSVPQLRTDTARLAAASAAAGQQVLRNWLARL